MTQSYDGQPTRYTFAETDFGGASNTLYYFKGPLGKAGLLVDYGVDLLTEVFAGGDSTPKMSIGIVGTAAKHGAAFDFGALAIASGSKSILTTYAESAAGYSTYVVDPELAADVAVMVTCVASVGAGLTGKAVPFVTVIWEN